MLCAVTCEREFRSFVDASYWNLYSTGGDFSQLAANNVDGIMLRAGKGYAPAASDYGLDRAVLAAVANAESARFPWWLYWRVFDPHAQPGVEQAADLARALEQILDVAGHIPGPIIIDTEEDFLDLDTGEQIAGPLTRLARRVWHAEFRGTLDELGFSHVGVYTRQNWWEPFVGGSWGEIPVIVADWVDAVDGVRPQPSADARTWKSFVDDHQPGGPATPRQWGRWDGWQFISAGSGLGEAFGFDSTDIGCNLIDAELFDSWFPDR